MRSVVSSEIVSREVQVDGRESVRELHVLDDGTEEAVDYITATDAVEDNLSLHAAMIQARLAAEEEEVPSG